MEKRKHRALDFIAMLLCVFDVDWDSGFAPDGCRDLWGRDAADEPVWQWDETPDNLIEIPRQTQQADVSGE